MVSLHDWVTYMNELLDISQYKDYGPNGLQVEGASRVASIVSGVTASQALIEQALAAGAEAIIVHHGYFWRGEDAVITGMKRNRLKLLLQHDISLVGYHLPLDAHLELGNNAQLAKRLGLVVEGRFKDVGLTGYLQEPSDGEQFRRRIQQALGREPLHMESDRPIKTIAWCSGGAQGYAEDAARLGVDAYLTGEASEYTFHIAREYGMHYFAAGHHATERYGIQALGEHVAEKFGLSHQFVDIDNPV